MQVARRFWQRGAAGERTERKREITPPRPVGESVGTGVRIHLRSSSIQSASITTLRSDFPLLCFSSRFQQRVVAVAVVLVC